MRATVLAAAWGLGACSGEAFVGSFVGEPFGTAGARILELEATDLGSLMTELETRYRTYLALREALPFEALVLEACFVSYAAEPHRLAFTVDVTCAIGEGAAGLVQVEQSSIQAEPVPVTRIALRYQGCTVAGLSVEGAEVITETESSDGASVRELDLVQNGTRLAYRFRVSLTDGTTVLDYEVSTPGGPVQARLRSPSTTGALATVILTGADGVLVCEIRDADWEMGSRAKGFCDDGTVFGIPTTGS
jgi:hypothetical protein